jgi:hypothetical protein
MTRIKIRTVAEGFPQTREEHCERGNSIFKKIYDEEPCQTADGPHLLAVCDAVISDILQQLVRPLTMSIDEVRSSTSV